MKKYRDRILEKRQQIIDCKKEIKDIEKQWIEEHHPLNVGDTVESVYYNHKEMVVDELYIHFHGDTVWFGANGKCVKKDGEVGKQKASKSIRFDIN